MWLRVLRWLENISALPDQLHRKQAVVLQFLIFGQLTIYLLFTLYSLYAVLAQLHPLAWLSLLFWLIPALLSLLAAFLVRRGWLQVATALTLGTFSLTNALYLFVGGLTSAVWIAIFAISVPIVVAGILGRAGLLWGMTVFWIGVVWVIGVLYQSEPTSMSYPRPDIEPWTNQVVYFALIVLVLVACLRQFSRIYLASNAELVTRQHELEAIRNQQETLIANRTAELQTTLLHVEQQRHELAQTLTELQQSQALVAHLHAPLITVLPQVILVPLIGIMNAERSQTVLTSTLAAVEREHARLVIIDLTGIELIDTVAATTLVELNKTVQLLGAKLWMVGMRPEIAQTMVGLGVDVQNLPTYADLWSAVAQVLHQSGWHQSVPSMPTGQNLHLK